MPTPLAPLPEDVLVRCARGTSKPEAIAWFGFSAFWGHLRHLLASGIATENIDSRTWMIPDPPASLLEAMVAVLADRGAQPSDTLAGALGGEVWIDFVADTGDDATVSEAVARLLAEDYTAPDPDDASKTLLLPRAQLLFHGGDLAYPVATSLEVTRRLVDPWNRVLEPKQAPETQPAPRVLVAVPGNHDWYDGLDGFARLCQAPCGFEETPDDALHPAPNTRPVWAWAAAFARGEAVRKPGAMALAGYIPVQRASYFRLPLTKDLELFAVDRQLRQVDPRQKAYFAVPREETKGRLIVLPDPVRAWGELRPDGVASLAALGIEPKRDPSFVLAGDVHHYERSSEGPSVHVVAGGGGAFLHGARVAKGGRYPRVVEFPGPKASRALLARLPWHVASGGAGWVVTAVFALADAIALVPAGLGASPMSLELAAGMGVSVSVGAALLVGWRRHRLGRVIAFATMLGIVVGALPIVLGLGLDAAGVRELGHGNVRETVTWVLAWMLSTWTSGFAFGGLLQLIAWLGLNHAQPYAALGEPGYKGFLRLRVRERETGETQVDAFAIGQVDPVRGSAAVLVDAFRWGPGFFS